MNDDATPKDLIESGLHSLDEAIRLAQAMPADDVVVEIRPIAFRPDA